MTLQDLASTLKEWVPIAGGVTGLAGLAIAVWSARSAAGSKEAAVSSATHAERSASAAERSAQASEASAVEARRTTDIKADERHDDLAPDLPDVIEARVAGKGLPHTHLVAHLTFNRDYRVKITGIFETGSTTTMSFPSVARAGEQHQVSVEHWSSTQKQPRIKAIQLDVWPPVRGDVDEMWSCPCDRPNDHGGPGHWQRRIVIKYVPPPRMVVM